MKRTYFNTILVMFVLVFAASSFAGTAHEFDIKGFKKIAKRTVGKIISGNVDADKMISDMHTLVEIGVAGCKEHMGEAETPAVEKKLMKMVVDNANKMSSLSLDKIEAQWHEGGYAKAHGVDLDKFDHFDEVMCHYDTIVHPATAIICLEQYKNTKKDDLLEQVQAELKEVIEHLKHLE